MKTYKKLSGERLTSPIKLLIWTVLLIPALKSVVLGTPMLITAYLKERYFYLPGNTAVTLIYEIILILFQIVGCITFVTALMSLGFYAVKKGIKKTLKYTGIAVLFHFFANMLSVAVSAVVVLLGYSDSENAFGDQLFGYFMQVVSAWLVFSGILLLITVLCGLLGYFTGRMRVVSENITPFMLLIYALVAVRTVLSLVEQIPVAKSAYAEEGFSFAGCMLPFVYPLIYCGIMLAVAVYFSGPLGRYYYKLRDAGKFEA